MHPDLLSALSAGDFSSLYDITGVSITIQERLEALNELNTSATPEHYSLQLHMLLEGLAHCVPTSALTYGSAYQARFEKEHPGACGLEPLIRFEEDRIRQGEVDFNGESEIPDAFSLLKLTYSILRWHHKSISGVLFIKTTFISPLQMWDATMDNVELPGMIEIRCQFLRQLKRFRSETQNYLPKSTGSGSRTRNRLGLRRGGSIFKFMKPTAASHSSTSTMYLCSDLLSETREFKNAGLVKSGQPKRCQGYGLEETVLLMSRFFFGSIYKGHACEHCAERYRREYSCMSFRVLQSHIFHFFSRRILRRAVPLVVKRFARYHDEPYLKHGIMDLIKFFVLSFEDSLHKDCFHDYVKLMTSILRAALDCGIPGLMQCLLRDAMECKGWPDTAEGCWMYTHSKGMIQSLLTNASAHDMLKYLALGRSVDLDCLCLGRFLESIILERKDLLDDMLLWINERQLLNIARNFTRIGSSTGGERLRAAVGTLITYLFENECYFRRLVDYLRTAYGDVALRHTS
jgi:hypothetical protein